MKPRRNQTFAGHIRCECKVASLKGKFAFTIVFVNLIKFQNNWLTQHAAHLNTGIGSAIKRLSSEDIKKMYNTYPKETGKLNCS